MSSVLTELGDVQIPLLALMLLAGCAAKASRAFRARSIADALGPSVLFPARLRPWVAGTLCAVELLLGVGLILTAGQLGDGAPARLIRFATCMLFVVATFGLIELRSVRPDIGCGCFGEFSTTPVSARTLVRSTLLAVAASSAVRVPPMMPRQLAAHAGFLLFALLAEGVLFGLLSPELRDVLVRIGYSAPCELRVTSPEQTIAALERSKQFRRNAGLLASSEPLDVWRELCWRYVAYPSRHNGRDAELVFAVYLQQRRPAVLSVLVDAATGAVIPWPATTAHVAGRRQPVIRPRGSHAAPQAGRPDLAGRPARHGLAGWLDDRRQGQTVRPQAAYAADGEWPDVPAEQV